MSATPHTPAPALTEEELAMLLQRLAAYKRNGHIDGTFPIEWVVKLLDAAQAARMTFDPADYEKPPSERRYHKEIEAAHPANTDDHKTYLLALELVSERHSKYDLVDLVNWLLTQIEGLREGLALANSLSAESSVLDDPQILVTKLREIHEQSRRTLYNPESAHGNS